MEEHKGETLRNFFSALKAAVFATACLFLFPSAASAASLYLSPANGTYKVGQTFTVGVYVNSDQAVNAYSGTITFPEDQVEVTGLAKTGITSLWVQDPSYSNGRGTANFEGIVLNPGFTGNGGKIITLTFKAKKAGTVPVRFTDGTVLANDGEGTNILAGFGHGTFAVIDGATATSPPAAGQPAEPAPSPAAPAPSRGVPGAPSVTSSTHPDPDAWYNNKNPAFAWNMPAGITGVNVLADRDEKRDPGTRSDGVFSKYDYKDVDDGTWYFHVKLQNSAGWGATSHFRFQVDTAPPTAPAAHEANGVVGLTSSDALSGLDRFEIAVDSQPFLKFPAAKEGETKATLPVLAAGEHALAIRAVDRAGNVSAETPLKVQVSALGAPRLTDVPDVVYDDESLRVLGETVPDGAVTVRLTPSGEDATTFDVAADKLGRFGFTSPKRLAKGTYAVSAKVKDPAGRESAWSEDLAFRVQERPAFNWLLFTLFLLLAVILAILCLILAGDRRKQKSEGDKLVRKFQELQETVHEAFDALREDTQKQLKLMERAKNKRELTAEEEKITRHLRRTLDWSEKLIEQEVEEARTLARKQKRSK